MFRGNKNGFYVCYGRMVINREVVHGVVGVAIVALERQPGGRLSRRTGLAAPCCAILWFLWW